MSDIQSRCSLGFPQERSSVSLCTHIREYGHIHQQILGKMSERVKLFTVTNLWESIEFERRHIGYIHSCRQVENRYTSMQIHYT